MASLYCETHGREREAMARADDSEMKEDGESILIVCGRLIRAPHSCIAYAARDRNQPAISSRVTSCRAEANAP